MGWMRIRIRADRIRNTAFRYSVNVSCFSKKTVFCGNFFSFLNFLNFVVVDVSTFKIEEELYSSPGPF